jgi:hypothetical protein
MSARAPAKVHTTGSLDPVAFRTGTGVPTQLEFPATSGSTTTNGFTALFGTGSILTQQFRNGFHLTTKTGLIKALLHVITYLSSVGNIGSFMPVLLDFYDTDMIRQGNVGPIFGYTVDGVKKIASEIQAAHASLCEYGKFIVELAVASANSSRFGETEFITHEATRSRLTHGSMFFNRDSTDRVQADITQLNAVFQANQNGCVENGSIVVIKVTDHKGRKPETKFSVTIDDLKVKYGANIVKLNKFTIHSTDFPKSTATTIMIDVASPKGWKLCEFTEFTKVNTIRNYFPASTDFPMVNVGELCQVIVGHANSQKAGIFAPEFDISLSTSFIVDRNEKVGMAISVVAVTDAEPPTIPMTKQNLSNVHAIVTSSMIPTTNVTGRFEYKIGPAKKISEIFPNSPNTRRFLAHFSGAFKLTIEEVGNSLVYTAIPGMPASVSFNPKPKPGPNGTSSMDYEHTLPFTKMVIEEGTVVITFSCPLTRETTVFKLTPKSSATSGIESRQWDITRDDPVAYNPTSANPAESADASTSPASDDTLVGNVGATVDM